MSRGWRIALFGAAGAAVIAGGICAAAVSGVTGEVLTIVLISGGLAGALLLVFLEIGLDEERDLARDEERRRKRATGGRPSARRSSLPRWPRRPG